MRITAVGDISFAGSNSDKPNIDVFSSAIECFRYSDLVVGNLENPLTDGSNGIKGKCILRGSTGWAGILKRSGFDVLSLANNHMMDYGEEGLLSTIQSLDREGVVWLGAGMNEDEARAPRYKEIDGIKVALLARSAVEVSSRCYAGKKTSGVANLNIDETMDSITQCKKYSDVVVLLLHWGIENYLYPSPKQRLLAKSFVNAGVDLILGHHPHVLQGVEKIHNSYVAYSIGNFLFDNIIWNYCSSENVFREFKLNLSKDNRYGIALQYILESDGKSRIEYDYTVIDDIAKINLDTSPQRTMDLKKLERHYNSYLYSMMWKLYSINSEYNLRLQSNISPGNVFRKLGKVRLRHVGELINIIKRSAKIVTEKSTNPYE